MALVGTVTAAAGQVRDTNETNYGTLITNTTFFEVEHENREYRYDKSGHT